MKINENKELGDAIKQLCSDITEVSHTVYPSLAKYNSTYFELGRKYAKIISHNTFNGEDRPSQSVWGFINLVEGKFQIGDVLKANSWTGPVTNKSRGNLMDGYEVERSNQHGPHYLT